ncbi:MAG: hypothetical protein ACHP7C_02705, partial [Lysobacterales bacterium]
MNYRKTLLAASIITSLCVSGALFAQDATPSSSASQSNQPANQPAKKEAKQLSTVMVTGIRDSEAESLALKKDAASHIEVVTAEDIGKL